MTQFTDLELAALTAALLEHPECVDALRHQISDAVVTERKNTGAGFFTEIDVTKENRATCGEMIWPLAYAKIEGLHAGFGFIVHLQDGTLCTLEGYNLGDDDTSVLDLENLTFELVTPTAPAAMPDA